MCTRLGIEHRFAPVCYPQYNSQWRSEAVLPIEVCLPNIRQIGYEEDKNDDRLRENLDRVDELKDRALIRMQEHKQEMSRFYNRRVKNRKFKEGDSKYFV
ncbi:hypothetical protein LIER_21749 [Lithospermum erythrorhizon]|uniref:Uncharacterized protein n=1 Tax=Lithospermum erythrorhizon TaxID=34254 RepID=A0AAV3QUH4_LITER